MVDVILNVEKTIMELPLAEMLRAIDLILEHTNQEEIVELRKRIELLRFYQMDLHMDLNQALTRKREEVARGG